MQNPLPSQQGRRFHDARHVLSAIVILAVASCLSITRAENPPYAVLLIHGISSKGEMWNSCEIIGGEDAFFARLGWSSGGFLDFDLNSDFNIGTHVGSTDADVDVRLTSSSLGAGNYFVLNFDIDDHLLDTDSNEAAILKQGKALGMAIEKIRNTVGPMNFVILGHSMGGLAAREYLQRRDTSGAHRWWPNGHHNVDALITLDTPHLGSNHLVGDFINILTYLEVASRGHPVVPSIDREDVYAEKKSVYDLLESDGSARTDLQGGEVYVAVFSGCTGEDDPSRRRGSL